MSSTDNEAEKRVRELLSIAVQTFNPCIAVKYNPHDKTLSYEAPPEMEAALLKVFAKYITTAPPAGEDTVVE